MKFNLRLAGNVIDRRFDTGHQTGVVDRPATNIDLSDDYRIVVTNFLIGFVRERNKHPIFIYLLKVIVIDVILERGKRIAGSIVIRSETGSIDTTAAGDPTEGTLISSTGRGFSNLIVLQAAGDIDLGNIETFTNGPFQTGTLMGIPIVDIINDHIPSDR